VTKQGDRVSLQGILTGGSPENGAGGILSKKREVKTLSAKISKLDISVNVAQEKQKELETEAVSLETQLQQARHGQSQANHQLHEMEKELFRLQERLRHTRRHLEILYLEEEQLEGERADIDEEYSRHQEVLAELAEQIQAEEATVGQTNASIKEIAQALEAVNDKVVELKLQLTTLQAEYDSSANALRRLADFRTDRDEKLAQLERSLKETQEDKAVTQERLERDRARLSELYSGLETMQKSMEHAENEYQAIEGALQQNDQALSEVRTRQQETFQKIQQLELKQSESKMRRDHLVDRIESEYGQQLELLAKELHTQDLSVEETQKTLMECKERIGRIGDVNLTAIEEYETLSERHGLLTKQRDDLEDAIEALQRVIRKINRVSLKRFMKTFKAVNEKIQIVFPKLFEGGGTAKLALTTPRRPLESGVSFLVRPPGKRLTRMSLLSGGEKALAAISLVFSLFLIKPTAFCVLDEIDAPLDDVNVYRFNQLLKEIGKRSQVVMITHDRQTMETASALFGVTMEQKGVSKLLSLDLTTS
jgi:chromosome segregation protein